MDRDKQSISTSFKYKWTDPVNAHGLGSIKRGQNAKYFWDIKVDEVQSGQQVGNLRQKKRTG